MLGGGTHRGTLVLIGTFHALLKGISVYYLLLLPILYATGVIDAKELGYGGALMIAGMMLGSLAVYYTLHRFRKVLLLLVTQIVFFLTTFLLFWADNSIILFVAYGAIGIAHGVAMSNVNAISAQFTTQGKRYGAFAKIAMATDIVRLVYPILAGLIFVAIGFHGLIYFAFAAIIACTLFLYTLSRIEHIDADSSAKVDEGIQPQPIRKNRPFFFATGIEFFDAIASSQLFVFLPALLLAKDFSIENALYMQSAVFAGYLTGRWLVGWFAHRFSGFAAVGIAEIGMIITIVAILVVPPSQVLYFLCFMLGVFTRGTSPVIKALVADRLDPSQQRRGIAIYQTIGEAGSALAQLCFGFLLAWYGATAPFIASILFAALVAVACLTYRESRKSLA